jgi:hypothetical protein
VNKLCIGLSKEIELPKGGFLYIGDEVPDVNGAKIFEPRRHSFDLFKGMNHKRAREISNALYTISPQGENTLTVRNGKRELYKALKKGKRFDRLRFSNDDAGKEAGGAVEDLLESPILRRVLCEPPNFLFNPVSKIVARLNRAELGEDDALALTFLLMVHFKGQIVVLDGSCLRECHISLVRENRLIAGVNTLNELPPKLRQRLLSVEKVASGTTFKDAEELADYMCRFPPNTDGYNTFIENMMA